MFRFVLFLIKFIPWFNYSIQKDPRDRLTSLELLVSDVMLFLLFIFDFVSLKFHFLVFLQLPLLKYGPPIFSFEKFDHFTILIV